MRPEQQQYFDRASKLPWFAPSRTTDADRKTWLGWFKRQTDLKQDKINVDLFWSALCLIGQRAGYQSHLPVTEDNLNALKASAELSPLLERIEVPKPHLVTPDERKAAEEAMAKMDRSWRGDGRQAGPDSPPFAVCYNSVENLDRIVDYVNTECFGVASGETFLIGFRTLLSKGELTPMKKEQRPTHNPPATPSSIRAAREADAKQHADTRLTVQQIRAQHREFEADYDVVFNYRGTVSPASGLPSHAATYSGQKKGYTQLKTKWDGKFTGDDLKVYENLMADLAKQIERRNPSGGTVKINDKDDRPNEYRGGGSI